MALWKGNDLIAGSLHDAMLFGRKRPFNGKTNPLLEEPGKNGRKPFCRMTRSELTEYKQKHIHVKSRTSVGRMFPGFYIALKDEKNKGLIDELFPLEKQKKPPRERRDWKSMDDDARLTYFRKHYAGDITSWSGGGASLKRLDKGFYDVFVTAAGLHRKINLCGEPMAHDSI